ncbi:glycosyl hydrolase [Leucosporidium creatinivorum]|uniref:Glycosyl hydrolase n=1 Tax=Leucosporidium creatinivorum TaxID=106004 RepID=A0A1Y2E2G6_9BASI|nr:glycosyl hydrolase [Leucosporidium creatinivorum]
MNALNIAVGALLLSANSAACAPSLALRDGFHPAILAANSTTNSTPPLNSTTTPTSSSNSSTLAAGCSLDQATAPGNLTLCGNATLFNVWRPKARVIGREGWANDNMGIWQRDDGSLHVGWQCNPQHIQWGNISMCAATSTDLVTYTDLNKTLWPSEIYDIRGVFDGTIIKDGFNGKPSILYTSTYPGGPLGATVKEVEGVETQSIAYTEDEGKSWIKLPYTAGGNPVIYDWPMQNLTGFRDPYVFKSPRLAALLGSSSATNITSSSNSSSNSTESDLFATISGGVHGKGAKLFLYRQNETGNVLNWDYISPLLETGVNSSWSEWSGNTGNNFETASANRLNATGDAFDAGDDETAVDFLSFGTENGRDQIHQKHWALWAAVNYTATSNGTVSSEILYAGVTDWGQSYAFVNFPYNGSRQIGIGWTYEGDTTMALAKQQGYQGAFTAMRDVFVKYTPNVDPTDSDLSLKASWGVKNESDGTTTVSTLGQRIIPELLSAWKAAANVSTPNATTLSSDGYQPFEQQPTDRYYVLKGQFDFERNSTGSVGFRVLASDSEYTDILYDPVAQNLTVAREMSSLVNSYDNTTELGKLKLWRTLGSNTTTLNLTVIVDNSVIEVHANDEFALTTRVYPWLSNSTGTGFLSSNVSGSAVKVSNVELWDGLVDAWPERSTNTSTGLVWDGPTAAIYGLWTGI